MQAEDIEAGNERQTKKASGENAEEQRPVRQWLRRVDGQASAFAEQIGIDAIDRDGAHDTNEEQNAEQDPSARPRHCAGGAEQNDRDEDRVREESADNSEFNQSGRRVVES